MLHRERHGERFTLCVFAGFKVIKFHDLGLGFLEIDSSHELFCNRPEKEKLPNNGLSIHAKIQC